MADEQEKDLQKFLKNVDEITTLIQEMNSDDPEVQEAAVLKTEKRLLGAEGEPEGGGCRITRDKTVISPPQAPAEVPFFCCTVRSREEIQRGGLYWSRGGSSSVSTW